MIAFFIQSAHSLVGGAASMDFGGKKAVATAAGLFDGAQYLAGAIVARGLGTLLDAYKDPKSPGAEYDVWPLAPLPFAIIGAILIARLWYVVPGRKPADPTAEALAQRARMLALLHKVQRVTLGAYAALAGAASVLTVILPQHIAKDLAGHGLPPSAIVQSQLHAGVRLGLAMVALAAAFTPRPPRALVRAVLVALIACVVGPVFSAITGGVPWTELATLKMGLWLDGSVAAMLLGTGVARSTLGRTPVTRAVPRHQRRRLGGGAQARHRPLARRAGFAFATSSTPRCRPISTARGGTTTPAIWDPACGAPFADDVHRARHRQLSRPPRRARLRAPDRPIDRPRPARFSLDEATGAW